jgi:hypothetical protein
VSDSGGTLGTTGGGGDVCPSGGSDYHAKHRGCGGQLVRAPVDALLLSDEGDRRSDHFDNPR